MRLVRKIALGCVFLAVGLSSCVEISKVDSFLQLEFPQRLSKTTSQKTINPGKPSTLERAIHAQVNKYRQSQNLPPLQLDVRISEQAKAHSQAMANGKVPFSHQGFEQRVNAIEKSIAYRSAGENVAYNQGYSDPATQAVQGWLKSPGHLKNIRGDFNLTGIGVVKNNKGQYYFTQVFIRSR